MTEKRFYVYQLVRKNIQWLRNWLSVANTWRHGACTIPGGKNKNLGNEILDSIRELIAKHDETLEFA
jgi:hypothetical protein